ncbi:hypothetical protein [Rubritalea tangerina]|uniref:hypothetical protein n=1 Tax=Rubritalea tangerina TaxID=430798 RepID=UPI0036086FC3
MALFVPTSSHANSPPLGTQFAQALQLATHNPSANRCTLYTYNPNPIHYEKPHSLAFGPLDRFTHSR